MPRPGRRGAVPNGRRSLYFLVQVPRESRLFAPRPHVAPTHGLPSPPPEPRLLQNFKREEQNFVVINEINNMSFLTADSKSKMSKVS